MESRRFNGIMPQVNHKWASNVLNIPENTGNGPDLIGDGKFVEIKFSMINPKNTEFNYPKSWTVMEHQVDYTDIFVGTGFWGLGLYELNCAVKSIRTANPQKLESKVVCRELYLIPWSWIYKFEPSHTSGKTEISEWEYIFRYPRFSEIPKTTHEYTVNKGRVYITKDVDPDLFDIETLLSTTS